MSNIAQPSSEAQHVAVEAGPGQNLLFRRSDNALYRGSDDRGDFLVGPEMGVGLSICRSIINAHGSRIWVEPNTPRGAIFRFTVPRGNEAFETVDGNRKLGLY